MRKLVWVLVLGLVAAYPCAALRAISTAAPAQEAASTPSAAQKPMTPQSVKGSVVNEAGKPVAGAKVYVFGGQKTSLYVITDKAGAFTCRLPAGSRQSLQPVAVAPGYSYARADVWKGRPLKPIVLRREKPTEGVVVDEAGKPLAGVSVSFENAWGYSRGQGTSYEMRHVPVMPDALTDQRGRFTIGHMPDPSGFDQYNISLILKKPGRAEIRKGLGQKDLAGAVRIVLPVGGVFEGKMLLPDRSGPPKGNWNIGIRVTGTWGSDSKNAGVEQDGTFRVRRMPPGKISLAVEQVRQRDEEGNATGRMEPYALPLRAFDLKPAETRSVDLVLARAAVVKGTIVNAQTGKPMPGVNFYVRHAGLFPGTYGDSSNADKNGEFSLAVPAGDIEIHVNQVRQGEKYYYFTSDDAPGADLKLAEGETKPDLVVRVNLADAYDEGRSRPTPPDFELVPGTYALTWDPDLNVGRIYTRDKPKTAAEVKALAKKLPDDLSEKAMFRAQKLDGRGDAGLICTIEDGRKFYIDANRNWDLSDDAPIEFLLPEDQGRMVRMKWVEVQSHQGPTNGAHTTHPIGLRPCIYRSSNGTQLQFDRKGGWKGVLDTNKGKAEFALIDFDCTGVFSDRRGVGADLMPTREGDMIAIDTAARGKVNAKYSGMGGSFWFEPASKIAGKFYKFQASDVGDSLTVKPYTGALGRVDIKVGSVQGIGGGSVGGAYALTPNGMYDLSSEKPPFTVPVGRCRIYYGSAELKSDTGGKVSIRFSTSKPVIVEADKTTTLDLAGNLSLAIDPEAKSLAWKPGQTATLLWAMKIGENISIDGIGNQSSADAPTVKLFDAKGKMAAKVKAGYT